MNTISTAAPESLEQIYELARSDVAITCDGLSGRLLATAAVGELVTRVSDAYLDEAEDLADELIEGSYDDNHTAADRLAYALGAGSLAGIVHTRIKSPNSVELVEASYSAFEDNGWPLLQDEYPDLEDTEVTLPSEFWFDLAKQVHTNLRLLRKLGVGEYGALDALHIVLLNQELVNLVEPAYRGMDATSFVFTRCVGEALRQMDPLEVPAVVKAGYIQNLRRLASQVHSPDSAYRAVGLDALNLLRQELPMSKRVANDFKWAQRDIKTQSALRSMHIRWLSPRRETTPELIAAEERLMRGSMFDALPSLVMTAHVNLGS